MHGKHTDEKRRAKQFKTEQPNGCTMKQIFAQMQSNRYTADGWWKFLNGCNQMMWNHPMQTDAIFFFARIAQAVRTIGPPNPFEWLMYGIQMAIRWKPQTTRNVFAWEVTIFIVFFPVIFISCWHYCLDKNLPVFKCPDYYLFAFQTVSTLATRDAKN